MLQQMAVIRKDSNNIRIPEVHAYANARICEQSPVIIRNIDRVSQEVLVYRPAQVIEEQKMQLVNMKCV